MNRVMNGLLSLLAVMLLSNCAIPATVPQTQSRPDACVCNGTDLGLATLLNCSCGAMQCVAISPTTGGVTSAISCK